MNEKSSRSHSVMTIKLESKRTTKDNLIINKKSKLNLIDLAGSERQKTSDTQGERLKEAANINKSLMCLGQVINSLYENLKGKKLFVNYRDSKLTYLLKDSLGGNSKTTIIACVSPSSLNIQESISTLNFADRAKQIRNKVRINEISEGSNEVLKLEIKKLTEELNLIKMNRSEENISQISNINIDNYENDEVKVILNLKNINEKLNK